MLRQAGQGADIAEQLLDDIQLAAARWRRLRGIGQTHGLRDVEHFDRRDGSFIVEGDYCDGLIDGFGEAISDGLPRRRDIIPNVRLERADRRRIAEFGQNGGAGVLASDNVGRTVGVFWHKAVQRADWPGKRRASACRRQKDTQPRGALKGTLIRHEPTRLNLRRAALAPGRFRNREGSARVFLAYTSAKLFGKSRFGPRASDLSQRVDAGLVRTKPSQR